MEEQDNKPTPPAAENKAAEQEKNPKQEANSQAAAQPQAPAGLTHKNKKINQMSLKEIEAKLGEIKAKTGSFRSRYTIELLKQKDTLLKEDKK